MNNIAQGNPSSNPPPRTDNAFIIGNGYTDSSRSNAFRVTWGGAAYAQSFNPGGADYAEMFEWQDGNPEGEDRRGFFVTLEGKHIRKAAPQDDYILGVVSATPSVVGDSQGLAWQDMHQRDKFGEIICEWVEVEQPVLLDESEMEAWQEANLELLAEARKNKQPKLEKPALPEKTQKVKAHIPKLNPAYDPNREYISRDRRKEWSAVGLMGKLIVLDDGSCQPNGYCTVGNGGIATASESGYRVLERLDTDTVRIVYHLK
ncbi:MAG: hypothetical protein FWF85_05090 [Clostridiales bacterium]|nr:hypothetical protein [Clostridiales bacterium]MDR2713372.1 hypothetical protein [Clostridiales bacterium]